MSQNYKRHFMSPIPLLPTCDSSEDYLISAWRLGSVLFGEVAFSCFTTLWIRFYCAIWTVYQEADVYPEVWDVGGYAWL